MNFKQDANSLPKLSKEKWVSLEKEEGAPQDASITSRSGQGHPWKKILKIEQHGVDDAD